MKVMAIQATAVDYNNQPVFCNSSRFDDLTLSQLGALTPKEYDFIPVVDKLDRIDFDADVDLVTISAMGVAPMQRAYDIAKIFRKRGVPVVLGGPNFSLIPEEASKHADSVVVGEAEPVWGKLLQDFRDGAMAPIYKANPIKDLSNLPCPRYDYFNTRKEFKGAFFTVEASRGCPNRCDFCAISAIHKGYIKFKPIDDVIRDVKATRSKRIFFADDNLMSNPKYYKELFRRLIPLKIIWIGATTISIGNDPEMLRLAKKSGCFLLIIGLETIIQKNIDSIRKKCNNVETYSKLIKQIHKAGIIASCTTMFGFDEDGPDVFEKTIDFYQENRVRIAPFFVLTPVPGTIMWNEMKKNRRIITDNYAYYDSVKAVFQPSKMTPHELENGLIYAYRKLYGIKNSIRRLLPPLGNPIADIVALIMNYNYNRLSKSEKFSAFNFG